MDSFEDDMFALSDDDVLMLPPKCNPVEEHLMKKLSDVQNRIEKTNNDIEEIQGTTRRVLKSLQAQAQYEEAITSDSDSDLYTIEGEPVIKMQKYKTKHRSQILTLKHIWKCIVNDKWVIGVILQNSSSEILYKPRFYIDVKDETEIHGASMIWHLLEDTFWYRTDVIDPLTEVIAVVILDVPTFDRESFSDAYGTISYEVDGKQYQTPVPTVRLLVDETIDNSCGIQFSVDPLYSILALKSMSIEKTVGIQVETNPERGQLLLEFLKEKSFKEICVDVYVVKAYGSLKYCLVEVLPMVEEEARLRISARSSTQMNVMLRLLRDQFPDLTIQEDNKCIGAAMALIQELELYLHGGSAAEKQRARIKTDLLVP